MGRKMLAAMTIAAICRGDSGDSGDDGSEAEIHDAGTEFEPMEYY
jgi:hypothetical protein